MMFIVKRGSVVFTPLAVIIFRNVCIILFYNNECVVLFSYTIKPACCVLRAPTRTVK